MVLRHEPQALGGDRRSPAAPCRPHGRREAACCEARRGRRDARDDRGRPCPHGRRPGIRTAQGRGSAPDAPDRRHSSSRRGLAELVVGARGHVASFRAARVATAQERGRETRGRARRARRAAADPRRAASASDLAEAPRARDGPAEVLARGRRVPRHGQGLGRRGPPARGDPRGAETTASPPARALPRRLRAAPPKQRPSRRLSSGYSTRKCSRTTSAGGTHACC